MTKKQKAAEEKRQQEIAAIECELWLIAAGAHGCVNVEDDPENGIFLYSTLGCKEWLTFIQAVSSHWRFHEEDEDGQSRKYMTSVYHLHHYENIEGAAAFLHEQGARAGGEWEAKR